MRTIGFLGAGNMAGAIAGGIAAADKEQFKAVYAYDIDGDKLKTGVFATTCHCQSTDELLLKADIIFLAIKPQVFPAVLPALKTAVRPQTVLVSIAAGITAPYIKELTGATQVVLVMPNTPLLVGAGATAVANCGANDEDFNFVKKLFGLSGGVCMEIEDSQMAGIIPVNGSSPAFLYAFAKQTVQNAVEYGIDEKTAQTLVAQTLVGAGKMILDTQHSIDELITMVSSPGGTTIAGLEAMEKNGFEGIMKATYDATVKRAGELQK